MKLLALLSCLLLTFPALAAITRPDRNLVANESSICSWAHAMAIACAYADNQRGKLHKAVRGSVPQSIVVQRAFHA